MKPSASPQTRRVFFLSLPIFAELLLQLLVGNVDQFMLSHVGTAAVAYDVLSIRDIVKYPIDKSAAVQSIGSICVGGGVAVRPYLGELAPAGVPADHQGFRRRDHSAERTTCRLCRLSGGHTGRFCCFLSSCQPGSRLCCTAGLAGRECP